MSHKDFQSIASDGQLRKISATFAVKPTGLMYPGQKTIRKPSDPASNIPKVNKTFAKPTPLNEASVHARSTNRVNGGLPMRNKTVVTVSKHNPQQPLTPTRSKGGMKLVNQAKSKRPLTSASSSQMITNKTAKSSEGLSTSIISTCSPSVQQSTPVRRISHASATITRASTVVKAASRTVNKENTTAGVQRGDEDTGACTPKTLVGSTPNRMRPKFRYMKIGFLFEGGGNFFPLRHFLSP